MASNVSDWDAIHASLVYLADRLRGEIINVQQAEPPGLAGNLPRMVEVRLRNAMGEVEACAEIVHAIRILNRGERRQNEDVSRPVGHD